MAMEASLQEIRQVQKQVDSITRRFATDPEGPLDGSIHPAFRFIPELPSPPNIEVEVTGVVDDSNLDIQDKGLQMEYVFLASSQTSRLDI